MADPLETQPGAEPVLEPDIAIVDTHHHLFDRASDRVAGLTGGRRRFLIDEYLSGIGGHRLVATVAVDGHAMYRADGPDAMKVVGETEFLNGQAAMAASGLYGVCRLAAAIVTRADLCRGEGARDVLEAHVAAAPERFKGIRQGAMWDADPAVVGHIFNNPAQLYLRGDFRRGFAQLAPLGLSFDAFVLAPQLPDVVDLARRHPETSIILNHVGGPVGIGRYTGKREEYFAQWHGDMALLAELPNVTVKLGGLGSFISGFASYQANPPASSADLAAEWQPYLEASIALFGVDRCMFESNYPVDCGSGSFVTVWNALKRVASGYSVDEKRALFAGTATRVYRIAG